MASLKNDKNFFQEYYSYILLGISSFGLGVGVYYFAADNQSATIEQNKELKEGDQTKKTKVALDPVIDNIYWSITSFVIYGLIYLGLKHSDYKDQTFWVIPALIILGKLGLITFSSFYYQKNSFLQNLNKSINPTYFIHQDIYQIILSLVGYLGLATLIYFDWKKPEQQPGGEQPIEQQQEGEGVLPAGGGAQGNRQHQQNLLNNFNLNDQDQRNNHNQNEEVGVVPPAAEQPIEQQGGGVPPAAGEVQGNRQHQQNLLNSSNLDNIIGNLNDQNQENNHNQNEEAGIVPQMQMGQNGLQNNYRRPINNNNNGPFNQIPNDQNNNFILEAVNDKKAFIQNLFKRTFETDPYKKIIAIFKEEKIIDFEQVVESIGQSYQDGKISKNNIINNLIGLGNLNAIFHYFRKNDEFKYYDNDAPDFPLIDCFFYCLNFFFYLEKKDVPYYRELTDMANNFLKPLTDNELDDQKIISLQKAINEIFYFANCVTRLIDFLSFFAKGKYLFNKPFPANANKIKKNHLDFLNFLIKKCNFGNLILQQAGVDINNYQDGDISKIHRFLILNKGENKEIIKENIGDALWFIFIT